MKKAFTKLRKANNNHRKLRLENIVKSSNITGEVTDVVGLRYLQALVKEIPRFPGRCKYCINMCKMFAFVTAVNFYVYVILWVSYSFAYSICLFSLYHISVTFPTLDYSSALKMEPCSPDTFVTTDLIVHFHDSFLP